MVTLVKPLRLFIVGASGGCGRALVAQAARAGHTVTALVRPGTAFDAPQGVTVVRGEVLSGEGLDAMAGYDVVLSGLGIRRKNPRNPWSPPVSPTDFAAASARRIVAAIKQHGLTRVIAISAAGVAESEPRMHFIIRTLFAHSQVGVAYRDLAQMEQVYRESGLDWLCVRPVTLTDAPLSGRVREVSRFGLRAGMPRADVAAWMLARAEAGGPVTERVPQIAQG
ncbi:MAG: NAD(P)H-binding protein [Deltaproteobacteria bacterium]|nr:NAD(P)H-binding protein [Deltaproteobacteria bacterium]